MFYWDSSAVVASILNEKNSIMIDQFVKTLPAQKIYTAVITPLEVESALQRRVMERSITPKELNAARITFTEFRRRAFLVIADHMLLDTALHLQKIYNLRPGDAIQLASARTGTDNPSKVYFLCLDEKLSHAANQEGFLCRLESIKNKP